jgi:putative Holliday junction resolvase
MGRVLGIDLGMKRTGLAVSDSLRISSRALANLTPRSRAEDVAVLVKLCADEEVDDVVIGLPLLPSGDVSPMAKRATGFAEALCAALVAAGSTTRVHLLDERDTSKQASARLVASAVKKSERKGMLDSEAARVLIELFVDSGPTTTVSAPATSTQTAPSL